MHKVELWPNVSDEIRAHCISLILGRYFTTPALLSHLELADWLAFVAVLLEYEVSRIVTRYGESLPEIPAQKANPTILAEVMIHRWRDDQELRAKFKTFLTYVDHVERMVEQGIPIEIQYSPTNQKEQS